MGVCVALGVFLGALVLLVLPAASLVVRLRRLTMNRGGGLVEGGIFLNVDTWEFVTVSDPQGQLPGPEEQRYLRLPLWCVLFLGPLMGLLFIAFLPLVGAVAIPAIVAGRIYSAIGQQVGRGVRH